MTIYYRGRCKLSKGSMLALFFIAVFFCARCPGAAENPDDPSQSRDWFTKHFDVNGRLMPFSFVYGDQASDAMLAAWPSTVETKTLDSSRTERRITWTDPKSGLEVRCVALEYSDFPAIEWTVYFKNAGQADTPILKDIQGLDATFQRGHSGEFILNGINGDWSDPASYAPYRLELGANHVETFIPRAGPTGPESGKSCDGPKGWPYFNLQMPGAGVIIAVGWPGEWASTFTRDASTGLRIKAGQELTHLYLKPGEEVRTPLIAMLFWRGTDVVQAQNLWRRWYIADNEPHVDGQPQQPLAEVPVSGGGADISKVGKMLEAGIRLDNCWRDAMGDNDLAWFPTAGGPYHKTAEQPEATAWWNSGTWDIDPAQYPNGFKPFSDWAHGHGLAFMLWFEPERVGNPQSWLALHHPEWLLPPRAPTYGIHPGFDPILDEGNPAALNWLITHVDGLIKSQGIDWYREDMNGGGPCPAWRKNDSSDRQGITENRYVQGHLAFWDALRRRNPHLRIDSCASGGRRNDLETMRRAIPLWRSDFTGTDPKNVEAIQGQTYGLSSWLPFQGSYSQFPDPYSFRSFYAPSFGQDGDIGVQKKAYGEWRRIAPYTQGDYYPLTGYSLQKDQWIAWQFDRPDLGQGEVQAFRRPESPYESARLKLCGLEAAARYEVENVDGGRETLTGDELMQKGLLVTTDAAPVARLFIYTRIK